MDIEGIKEKIGEGRYEISKHAEVERRKEEITLADIKKALSEGKIIEDYPDDPRGPSCLVLGKSLTGEPLHAVCAKLPTEEIRIVTVYFPLRDPKRRWLTPEKRRKG